MSSIPSLGVFADSIRATDNHAPHHLDLIERVESCLANFQQADGESLELAEKLERWRYQYLNELASQHLTDGTTGNDSQQALVEALDLTANRLAGRANRKPRATLQAVNDSAYDNDSIRQAIETLDPRYPLERLIQQASELTADHYGAIGSADSGAGDSGAGDSGAGDSGAGSPTSGSPTSGSPTSGSPTEGRPMLLYAPLYVSSYCVNDCTYCGFRHSLEIDRKHLTMEQVESQIDCLQQQGFGHLLIVGGDFPSRTSLDFYANIARRMKHRGIVPAIEIAPQPTEAYQQLVAAGVEGLALYQETYDRPLYAEYHIRGPKSHYPWRLEGHDRAAEAGVRQLGLGILLGLADVQQEMVRMMRHAAYLQQRFPTCRLSFSLPRIHEAPDGFEVKHPVSDEQLVRLYSALRVAFPASNLVLSTRESVELRSRLAKICITQMSAGSSTTPGGYLSEGGLSESESLVASTFAASTFATPTFATATDSEQFPISDHRPPAEVARQLEQAGFRVVWSPEVEG